MVCAVPERIPIQRALDRAHVELSSILQLRQLIEGLSGRALEVEAVDEEVADSQVEEDPRGDVDAAYDHVRSLVLAHLRPSVRARP